MPEKRRELFGDVHVANCLVISTFQFEALVFVVHKGVSLLKLAFARSPFLFAARKCTDASFLSP